MPPQEQRGGSPLTCAPGTGAGCGASALASANATAEAENSQEEAREARESNIETNQEVQHLPCEKHKTLQIWEICGRLVYEELAGAARGGRGEDLSR